MKDSAATPRPDGADQKLPRPSWRFSGRRGTPVHLRETTPSTLPPDIARTIEQLARERGGRDLRGSATQPVAGAPVPVERRARTGSFTPVNATPPEAVPAPAASAAPTATPSPEPIVEVPADPTPTTATETTDIAPEAVAEVEPESMVEPQPAAEPAAEVAAEPEATPAAPTTQPLSKSAKRRRAKQRAKQRRDAAKQAEQPRQLIASGRDEEQPAAIDEPAPTTSEPAPLAEVDAPEPSPVETEAPAPAEPLLEIPSVEAPSAPTAIPMPASGLDDARIASWDLGKLPILVTPTQVASTEPDDDRAPNDLGTLAWATMDEQPDDVPAPAAQRPEPAPESNLWTKPPTVRQPELRGTPASIERLDAPLFPPAREDGASRVRAREEPDAMPVEPEPDVSTSPKDEVRRRIAARRAAFDSTMAELATLGRPNDDA